MQNAGLASLGLNWRYLAFDVHPDHLRAALAGAKRMNFIGLNLTVPHKTLAFEMVDARDASAEAWGTVNTICFEVRDNDGQWRGLADLAEPASEIRARGFNTDAEAVIRSLREDLGFCPEGKRVLLLGAGGAGRTAALKLAAERVAELFLVNRTRSKAQAVAAEIRDRYPAVTVTTEYPAGEIDLLLNATSLGLSAGDPLPLAVKRFRPEQASAVYDMIYRPAATALLALAEKAGCRTANGLGMLLYQGAAALEIWTGKPAPVAIMREALQKSIYGQ